MSQLYFKPACRKIVKLPPPSTPVLLFSFWLLQLSTRPPQCPNVQHHDYSLRSNNSNNVASRSRTLSRSHIKQVWRRIDSSRTSDNSRNEKQETGNDRNDHEGDDEREEKSAGVNRLLFHLCILLASCYRW
jgi:hypothetical protein